MVPWISDARLVFLVWFVSIAVVVAVLLIFVEIKLKKKRALAVVAKREKTPIERMKIILNKEGDVKRKFEAVDKTARNYFQEEYGMGSDLDYSELAKRFEKMGKKLEVEFCKKMFELYYSNKGVTEEIAEKLGDMLVGMSRKKTISKDMARVPDVWEKIDRTFESKKDVVVSKLREHVTFFREKMERKDRVEARKEFELLSWIKKAIRMGHDRKTLFGLLKDDGKNRREIKGILKTYDKEFTRTFEENAGPRFYSREEGVAQRVIRKEKNRLEELEAPRV